MKNACDCCIYDKTCENKERETECGKYYYKPWLNEPHLWTDKTIFAYRNYEDLTTTMGTEIRRIMNDNADIEDAIAYILALQDR